MMKQVGLIGQVQIVWVVIRELAFSGNFDGETLRLDVVSVTASLLRIL